MLGKYYAVKLDNQTHIYKAVYLKLNIKFDVTVVKLVKSGEKSNVFTSQTGPKSALIF